MAEIDSLVSRLKQLPKNQAMAEIGKLPTATILQVLSRLRGGEDVAAGASGASLPKSPARPVPLPSGPGIPPAPSLQPYSERKGQGPWGMALEALARFDDINRQWVAPIVHRAFSSSFQHHSRPLGRPSAALSKLPWEAGYMDEARQGLAETDKIQRFLAENWWAVTPISAPLRGVSLLPKVAGLAKIGSAAHKAANVVDKVEMLPFTAGKAGIGKLKKIATSATVKMPDLQSFDNLVAVNFVKDGGRKIAQQPFVREILGNTGVGLNPAALADTPAAQMIVGKQMSFAESRQKTKTVMSIFDQYGGQEKVFGPLDKDGFLRSPQFTKGGAKIAPNDIRGNPGKYKNLLDATQKKWVKTARELEYAKLKFLERNGISIKKLSFAEGGETTEYAGRRVFGKLLDDGTYDMIIVDAEFVKAASSTKSGMLNAQKRRVFATQEEALNAGFSYLPEEEALRQNIAAAYRKVAEKQATEWFVKQVDDNLVPGISFKSPLPANFPQFAGVKGELPPLLPKTFPAWHRFSPVSNHSFLSITKIRARADMDAIKRLEETLQEITGVKGNLLSKELVGVEWKSIPLEKTTAKAVGEATRQLKAQLSKAASVAGKVADKYMTGKHGPKTPIRILSDVPSIQKLPYGLSLRQGREIFSELQRIQAGLTQKVADVDVLDKVWKRELKPKTLGKVGVDEFGFKHGEAPEALWGKILMGKDAKEVGDLLVESFKPTKFNSVLTATNKVNAIARLFVLAGDVSTATIQLLFLATWKPAIWGKSMKGFVQAMLDPEFHARVLAQNADRIHSSPNLILTRGGGPEVEITEAITGPGGLLASKTPLGKMLRPPREKGQGPLGYAAKTSLLAVPRIYGKGANVILKPFARAYEASLDVAGIELKKSLEHLTAAADPNLAAKQVAELDAFINEFRGLADSARLGMTGRRRQIQTAISLAPNYTRAITALLYDAAQGAVRRGGLRGKLARDSMAHSMAGLAALGTAVSIALGARTGEEIERHLSPMRQQGETWVYNPDFFTWTIAGQRIGPGSKVRSVIGMFAKTLGAVSGQITDDPGDKDLAVFIDPRWQENPWLQTGRAQSAPLLKTIIDIGTGKDYVGEPSRDSLWHLTDTVVAENLVPIWIHSVLFEGGNMAQRALRGITEFVGGRGHPLSAAGKRTELRNELANERYDKDWNKDGPLGLTEGLTVQEQNSLEKANPELIALNEEVSQVWLRQKGSDFDKAFAVVRDEIDGEFKTEMNKIAKLKQSGKISWKTYNDLRKKHMTNKFSRVYTAHMMKDWIDPESREGLERWLEDEHQYDKALRGYREYFYEDAKMKRDDNGLIDWGATHAAAETFLSEKTPGERQYIIDNQHDWINDLSVHAAAIERERQELINIIKPFWEIEDAIFEKVSASPGWKGIHALRETWRETVIDLNEQLDSRWREIPPHIWPTIRGNAKQHQAPQLIAVERLISNAKVHWKRSNPAGAMAVDQWYREI